MSDYEREEEMEYFDQEDYYLTNNTKEELEAFFSNLDMQYHDHLEDE